MGADSHQLSDNGQPRQPLCICHSLDDPSPRAALTRVATMEPHPRISLSQPPAETTLDQLSKVITAESHRTIDRQTVHEYDGAVQVGGARRWTIIVLILLCNLTQFVSMFSTVAGGFEFSKRLGHAVGPGQANWMAAAYSLTQSAFVLVSGRLGAVYGHHRTLLVGGAIIVAFSVANVFCTTYTTFVIMRAFTGIGGGVLMPNAVATLTIMIPPGKSRNVAMAFFASSPPIGAGIGALSAGAFLQISEWKYHFVTIACLMTVILSGLVCVLPHEDCADKDGVIDYVGLVLGLGGLFLFNLAWNQAPSVGWDTPYVLVMLILSVVLFAGFLVWEDRYAKEPIMPLNIFRASSFKYLILVVFFIYMTVGIGLWYMVAWQQLLRGWTVLDVAVGWIPYAIGASIAVFLAAWLLSRLQPQWILALGCLVLTASVILLATMPIQQSYWAQIFPATVLASFCPDFIYVAAQVIVSNSVSKREQGIAGSLVGTLNLYGNSLGLGFAGTIESQLARRGRSEVQTFRAALWFGAALAVAALIMDLVPVRMPKENPDSLKLQNSDMSLCTDKTPHASVLQNRRLK